MSMRYIGLVPLTLAMGFAASACGSSGDDGGSAKAGGEECKLGVECQSGVCNAGKCTTGSKGSGSGGSTGSGGSGASGGSSGTTGGAGGPPGFQGSGSAGIPLAPGCSPDTADQCGGTCEQAGGGPTTIVRPPVALCFAAAEDPTPNNPIALIEQVIETVNGVSMVHLRITFDPSFVDNTYGVNAVGWAPVTTTDPGAMPGGMMGGMMPPKQKGGHTFNDLVGSDHVELLLTDGSGATVMDFKIDYVSVDANSPCGYGTLGVLGGEGKVILGDASAVIGVATSIDRDLNGCGYCYTTDSPATDESYTPNPDTPNWDYRVVYEVWLSLDAFGAAGFGQAYIQNVHASPSKLASNTVEVSASPCPPGWDTPFCPPDLIEEGGNCGGQTGECQPNYELYISTEGQHICAPIPFANYPGMTPCPEGYALDPATEGRYCLPVK